MKWNNFPHERNVLTPIWYPAWRLTIILVTFRNVGGIYKLIEISYIVFIIFNQSEFNLIENDQVGVLILLLKSKLFIEN